MKVYTVHATTDERLTRMHYMYLAKVVQICKYRLASDEIKIILCGTRDKEMKGSSYNFEVAILNFLRIDALQEHVHKYKQCSGTIIVVYL